MSAPREHVEAVAALIRNQKRAWAHDSDVIANAILTSTDPAVHAAMLDALVRTGVLEWRTYTHPEGNKERRVVGEWESLP